MTMGLRRVKRLFRAMVEYFGAVMRKLGSSSRIPTQRREHAARRPRLAMPLVFAITVNGKVAKHRTWAASAKIDAAILCHVAHASGHVSFVIKVPQGCRGAVRPSPCCRQKRSGRGISGETYIIPTRVALSLQSVIDARPQRSASGRWPFLAGRGAERWSHREASGPRWQRSLSMPGPRCSHASTASTQARNIAK
jgi:hypothetical protein